jgi:hypothetical protein
MPDPKPRTLCHVRIVIHCAVTRSNDAFRRLWMARVRITYEKTHRGKYNKDAANNFTSIFVVLEGFEELGWSSFGIPKSRCE